MLELVNGYLWYIGTLFPLLISVCFKIGYIFRYVILKSVDFGPNLPSFPSLFFSAAHTLVWKEKRKSKNTRTRTNTYQKQISQKFTDFERNTNRNEERANVNKNKYFYWSKWTNTKTENYEYSRIKIVQKYLIPKNSLIITFHYFYRKKEADYQISAKNQRN